MTDEPPLKPVVWVGSSRKDLRKFPDPVQHQVGYAIYVAQRGGKHRDAKVLTGFGGAGVLEVVEDFRGDTFRAVYTLKYSDSVYVLHAFQKKSKSGRETPRRDMELIEQRLREAEKIAKREKVMSKKSYEIGSGNVFKDLGIPNAEEHLVKAQLVFKIDTIMKDRGLKQAEAADLLGVKQPDVSKMLRGDFRQFSVERLLRFLVALNHDVEIVVKPHRGRSDTAALHVS
jgi:phage-related protein/predicted XRE-type DNA-binding protein